LRKQARNRSRKKFGDVVSGDVNADFSHVKPRN
jgi:hypothetical protein